MKVKFFTEGGKNIGIGHLTRCLSLCQAFEEQGNKCFFVVKGNETIKNFLTEREIKISDWINDLKNFEREVYDTDIVVIDSYLAGVENYRIVCESGKKSLFIDDYNRIPYPCGVVLNGGVHAKELNYSENKKCQYLLGTEYIPLRKPFWDVEEKSIKKHIERILITFGGDDSENMTFKILNILKNENPEVEILVIISSIFKNKEQIFLLANDKIKILENLDAEGVRNLMLSADIAISAGGQTTYELARVGIPSILIAVSDNQLHNCKGWHKVGFAKYAGWFQDKKTIENLIYYFRELKDFSIRKKMSKKGRILVDGQGARRVIKKIMEDIK